jgi:hypothetical protein
MDMPPPAIQQCVAATQDVLVDVSGKAEQVRLFERDALTAYSGWKVSSIKQDGERLSIVLRGHADTPYAVVTGAIDNSKYRQLGSRVTFACGA